MTTYRINGRRGGMIARWVTSIGDAKERFRVLCREGAALVGDPVPVVTFATSTSDEDGDPCEEYIACFEDGRIEAGIFLEPPCWPDYNMDDGTTPTSPPLEMVAKPVNKVTEPCNHSRLICTDVRNPRIACASCYQMWAPDGGT